MKDYTEEKRSLGVRAARLMGLSVITPMKNAGAASYLGHAEMLMLPAKKAKQMQVLNPLSPNFGSKAFIVGISRVGGGDVIL